jgi:ABC-type uncharacterized transport system permease subunit
VTNPSREVIDMIFEFVLSILIILVAAFLIYSGVVVDFSCGLITLVTTFWFVKRSNEATVKTLLQQTPIISPLILPSITPVATPTPGPNGE